MSKLRSVITILAILFALFLVAAPATAGDGKAYGEPLSGTETIQISTLLADPDRYVGETVRVEGLVTGVCPKRGCWMSLASDVEFEELRLKVDDGVIVFPAQAKGKHAVAEGVFTKIEMSMEETLSYKEHHAEEHGEEFDPSTVTEPMTYYQIKTTGAVIQ